MAENYEEKRKEKRYVHPQTPTQFRVCKLYLSSTPGEDVMVNIVDLSRAGMKLFIPVASSHIFVGDTMTIESIDAKYTLKISVRYVIKWFETACFAGTLICKGGQYEEYVAAFDAFLEKIGG